MDTNMIYKIVKGPVLTEKATILKEQGKYVFEVHKDATKHQIKQAIEKLFKVKVVSVNILKHAPKKKRLGRFEGRTSAIKRAIVTLEKGQTISELEGV